MSTKYKVMIASAIFAAAMSAADAVPAADQNFAKAATEGGAAEVKLGQLAASKGQNQKVKDFGQRMVTDHGKAGDELKTITDRKGIMVSSELNSKDNALMNKLNGLSGSEFDKAYISAMVKDHQTDISDFQKEANNGKDSDLKGFASKTLPTLQEHLRMAQDAASTVGVVMNAQAKPAE